VGSPQIRNRGTIGGNLGTAPPAGDAIPPLLVEHAEVDIASLRGERRVALHDFVVGVKKNVLEPDELVVSVRVEPTRARQTFMKVGPRNAMVISVCSLALELDRERGELRAAFGSAAPTVRLVTAPLDAAAGFPELVGPRATSPANFCSSWRGARARSTTPAVRPPTAGTRSRYSRAGRSRGARHED